MGAGGDGMMKTPKHETPTFETLEKGAWNLDHLDTKAGGGRRLRRLDSDALDKALLDGILNIDQHTTLEAFRAQLYKAGLVFCPRAGLEVAGTSGQGQFMGDRAFSMAKRMTAQMNALAGKLTAVELNILLGVLTMDVVATQMDQATLAMASDVLDEFHEGKQ
jgi:hypothetical protein